MNVEVVSSKYTGEPHRHLTMRRLGVDEHGTWLGAPAGTIVHSGVPGRSFTNQHATARLVPVGRWWTAIFFAEPSPHDVYCDITTPARWLHPGSVTLVDLDLDVMRMRHGNRVDLLDEDEFTLNSAAYDYPAEVVTQARAAAAHLAAALAADAEPFATTYRAWLNLAAALPEGLA